MQTRIFQKIATLHSLKQLLTVLPDLSTGKHVQICKAGHPDSLHDRSFQAFWKALWARLLE